MLLFVGRLNWVKSVDNLVQAMPKVLEENPKTKFVFLRKDKEQRDIVETASKLGLKDKNIYRFEFKKTQSHLLCAATTRTQKH